ncbi:MAG: hypothetical protein HFJ45_04535 [Clostridia bacterium]|nr:hypothetical protein [Clostridia bacterium]
MRNRGVTLIALVITIIVLLILAGISLNFVIGEGGTVEKAKESSFKAELTEVKEDYSLDKLSRLFSEDKRIANIDEIINNIENAIALIKDKEDKENEIHEILQRMGELTIQCTNNLQQADEIKSELDSLNNEINNMINDIGIVNKEVVIGLDGEIIKIEIDHDITLDINLSTLENCENTLKLIETTIEKISDNRSHLGNKQNRLEYTLEYWKGIKEVLECKIENEKTENIKLSLVGLKNIQNCLDRIGELIFIAKNDTNTVQDIKGIYEIKELLTEINRIAQYTKSRSDVSLLNGEYNKNVNVLNILSLSEETFNSSESIDEGISKVDEAINKVSELRQQLSEEEVSYIINEYNIPAKWADKLKIIDGEIVYIGTDETERKWAEEVGIKVR